MAGLSSDGTYAGESGCGDLYALRGYVRDSRSGRVERYGERRQAVHSSSGARAEGDGTSARIRYELFCPDAGPNVFIREERKAVGDDGDSGGHGEVCGEAG